MNNKEIERRWISNSYVIPSSKRDIFECHTYFKLINKDTFFRARKSINLKTGDIEYKVGLKNGHNLERFELENTVSKEIFESMIVDLTDNVMTAYRLYPTKDDIEKGIICWDIKKLSNINYYIIEAEFNSIESAKNYVIDNLNWTDVTNKTQYEYINYCKY